MMIDLAQHASAGQPVGVRAIAERQDIARRYLEQIASQLRRAGLVYSRQGQSGGYVLARDSSKISVGEILEAVAGPVLLIECLVDNDVCERTPGCPSRRMWSLLETLMRSVLFQYFLDDLVEARLPPVRHNNGGFVDIHRCPLVSLTSATRPRDGDASDNDA